MKQTIAQTIANLKAQDKNYLERAKLYNKALKLVPGSIRQKEIIAKIKSLEK